MQQIYITNARSNATHLGPYKSVYSCISLGIHTQHTHTRALSYSSSLALALGPLFSFRFRAWSRFSHSPSLSLSLVASALLFSRFQISYTYAKNMRFILLPLSSHSVAPHTHTPNSVFRSSLASSRAKNTLYYVQQQQQQNQELWTIVMPCMSLFSTSILYYSEKMLYVFFTI